MNTPTVSASEPQPPPDAPDGSGASADAPAPPPPRTPASKRAAVPLALLAVVAAVLLLGHTLLRRANAQTNRVALASSPKGVTVIEARAATYRGVRRYVGTLAPWTEARVGPQLVAAYVSSVLVRPGALVRRGEVLATLDCRNTSATSRAIALQARALEARQSALAHQATRLSGLAQGGFVAANEVEQRDAESASEAARLAATRAQLTGSSLAVDDCVLRAPFAGEVVSRLVDPGAFVRPSSPVITVIDRTIVRVVVDVPETDFDAVAPGTPVRLHLLATDRDTIGTVARRSPGADPSTRTIHAEIDLADPQREIPVGTTAEVTVEVGRAIAATEIPTTAASLRGDRASLYVVEAGVARRRRVSLVGERGGSLFVEPTVLAGAQVVTEGRALLEDGDPVTARVEPFASLSSAAPAPPQDPAPAPPREATAAPVGAPR